MLNRQPVVSIIIAVVLVFAIAGTLERTFTAIVDSRVDSRALAGAMARFSASILLLIVLGKTGSGQAIGLTSPSTRGRRWWLPTLVMALLIPPRFLADTVDWSALQYRSQHAIDWLLRASSSGFFEEILMRGVCFYILCRVWATTRSGLQRAAVVQALLFGVVHLSNLAVREPGYVVFQICFATVIGYGFAGLTAYVRSLWPAIVLHAAINAAGSFDNHFAGSAYVFNPDTPLTMVAIIGAYFVWGAFPGYWCLQRARLFSADSGAGGHRVTPRETG